MLTLGYSINLLTLLALVLAIGLVVDDAIIVVENVDRHMKLGQAPRQAALLAGAGAGGTDHCHLGGAGRRLRPDRIPGGLTGALFSEFAFTLAGAVAVSALIALTLSPMMCARFFKLEHAAATAWCGSSTATLRSFTDHYHRILRAMLDSWKVVVIFGAVVIALIAVMLAFPVDRRRGEERAGAGGRPELPFLHRAPARQMLPSSRWPYQRQAFRR